MCSCGFLGSCDPVTFRTAFLTWAGEVMSSLGLTGQIAVDGQTHRGSHDRAKGQKPIHVLSALSPANQDWYWGRKDRCKIERNHSAPRLAEVTSSERCRGFCGRHGMSGQGCEDDSRPWRRLLFGLKGNQSNLQNQTAALSDEVFDTRKRAMDEAAPPVVERHQSTDGGHG
jgi:hypothetical protein